MHTRTHTYPEFVSAHSTWLPTSWSSAITPHAVGGTNTRILRRYWSLLHIWMSYVVDNVLHTECVDTNARFQWYMMPLSSTCLCTWARGHPAWPVRILHTRFERALHLFRESHSPSIVIISICLVNWYSPMMYSVSVDMLYNIYLWIRLCEWVNFPQSRVNNKTYNTWLKHLIVQSDRVMNTRMMMLVQEFSRVTTGVIICLQIKYHSSVLWNFAVEIKTCRHNNQTHLDL